MTLPEALTVHVAAGRIRSAWLPGMRVYPIMADGSVEDQIGTVVSIMGPLPVVWWEDLNATRAHLVVGHLAPVDDPATNGGLLVLLREALDDPTVCVVYDHDAPKDRAWVAGRWEGDGFAYRGRPSPTEHAALSAALIALAESP